MNDCNASPTSATLPSISYSELILENRIEIPAIRVDEKDSVLYSNNDPEPIPSALVAEFKTLTLPSKWWAPKTRNQVQYIYYEKRNHS